MPVPRISGAPLRTLARFARTGPGAASAYRSLRADLRTTELASLPEFEERSLHVVTGLLLPIWDRLPGIDMRVFRLVTDEGERIVGRVVEAQDLHVTATLGRPWYMDALLLSKPLHFGDYGGMPMKILWAALDVLTIIVLGSGLYLWWVRRRAAVTVAKAVAVEAEVA